MANWDQAQLAEVVERRHGEDNRKKNATQIVSHILRSKRVRLIFKTVLEGSYVMFITDSQ
jgi:hypothetical protein